MFVRVRTMSGPGCIYFELRPSRRASESYYVKNQHAVVYILAFQDYVENGCAGFKSKILGKTIVGRSLGYIPEIR